MRVGQAVLVDTNIIIEAVRTGCWSAIRSHFSVATVEKCREEARTGDAHRPGYVVIDEDQLRLGLITHSVSAIEVASLMITDAEAFRLDAGERDLWAHAMTRNDAWLASCCDRAAVNAAIRLGWKDRLVSLEALAQSAGARSSLRRIKSQFSTNRLSEWRTAALLGSGLG